MDNTTSNTVVGIFEDYRSAERVVHDLTSAGIPRDSIEIKSNFMTGAAGRGATEEEPHEGGIAGFFHRLFGGEDTDPESGHYAEAVRRGDAVVCASVAQSQMDQVVQIMNERGAINVDQRAAAFRQTGYERHDPRAEPYTLDEVARERQQLRSPEGVTSIPVIEEELQIGKRVVSRGGVRVFSRVVEEPVEESVNLREEHVRVERRAVDRPVESADSKGFREQSITVTEMAEEPVVEKRARVREEVIVGKETTERTEQIRGKVRRTNVEVEPLGQSSGQSDEFRRDYETRYADSGVSYETFQPAYDYGYRTASDPRYRGRAWSDVEDDLQSDYLRSQPGSNWNRVKGAVRYGWEKVTGKL